MTDADFCSLLPAWKPKTSAGADALLDLRALLQTQGHPGKCLRCYFSLLRETDQPQFLLPLKDWLERSLQICVKTQGREIERLPVELADCGSTETFCHRTIRQLRTDRCHRAEELELTLSYKS